MVKSRVDILIDKNKIVDDGNGVISFKGGLTLSDESTQRNGTRYDIGSMDLSHYDGTVFADHDYSVTAIVGKAIGVGKRAKRLIAEGVEFAVNESPLARFVYEMVKSGFINAVSIGSMGELDEEGVYKNAQLLEFSFVGIGNNMNAKIAKNVLQKYEAEGLDTRELRTFLKDSKVYNGVDESEESDSDESDKQEEEKTMEPEVKTPEAPQAPVEVEEPKTDENNISEVVKNAVAEAVKPLADKVEQIEKNAFDKNAVEPEFVPGSNGAPANPMLAKNKFKSMDWRELTQMQIENFFKATKEGDADARKLLTEINSFNKEQLIETGRVNKNSITMGDFGNFVTNPELLTEIEGYRSDYSDLLRVFTYRETNSLTMAWLNRSGDIDMTPVEMCDDGADGNLKPISEYEATQRTMTLEEMAAVTPVCNSATIFLAADLLQDVSAGYRNSYDRNLARGIIAALELAAEDNDSASIAETGDLDDAAGANAWLGDIRQAIFAISQGNGVLVMNEATFGVIWNALLLTGNGGALTDTVANGQTIQQLWMKRFVIVPNDLMPTLGDTGTYKTFVLNGENVTINHAIFYVNPANFSGRQNGGLRYDLSTEAAYEVNGTVKSAYQRNEIVLRGSMFRGAVIRDHSRVGAVRAGAVIS